MDNNTEFTVIPESEMENHIESADGETPFSFSKTNVWNSAFYSPEISSGEVFSDLKKELEEIKNITNDIKNLLFDLFG